MPARSTVFKALAEPARWRIVERLRDEELCVCHLVEDLGLAQPLVSHHLKVLKAAGIVEADRFRQWTYYRLVPGVVATAARDLTAIATSCTASNIGRRPCC